MKCATYSSTTVCVRYVHCVNRKPCTKLFVTCIKCVTAFFSILCYLIRTCESLYIHTYILVHMYIHRYVYCTREYTVHPLPPH